MSFSITLQENIQGHAIYDNPNVYAGDINGNPVTPKAGVPCYLWAKPQNTGTESASAVNVSFFICIPSPQPVWPQSAHGSAALSTLAAGQIASLFCSVPWVPDSSYGSHQCLVAVVSCLDCPAPPTPPGQQVNPYNTQTAMHNVFLFMLQAGLQTVERNFDVINAPVAGRLVMTRVPLAARAATLQSLGVDPNLPEAPPHDKFGIVDKADGSDKGTTLTIQAGDNYSLHAAVEVNNTSPGTAAFYQVEQFEGDTSLGGVSFIILQ